MKQKFKKNDHVMIDKDLGPSMSHFTSGCEAIVLYSYHDEYGGGGRHKQDYGLYIRGQGSSAWYHEDQLTLIAHKAKSLKKKWKAEAKAEDKEKSDLDWIFAHGQEVIDNGYGGSIAALAATLGVDDLWGPSGEGFVYYQNAQTILLISSPFLKDGDKEGFLALDPKDVFE